MMEFFYYKVAVSNFSERELHHNVFLLILLIFSEQFL